MWSSKAVNNNKKKNAFALTICEKENECQGEKKDIF